MSVQLFKSKTVKNRSRKQLMKMDKTKKLCNECKPIRGYLQKPKGLVLKRLTNTKRNQQTQKFTFELKEDYKNRY